jgi:hypothetical protein
MYPGDPSVSPLPVIVSSMERVIARATPRSINSARDSERTMFSGFTSLCSAPAACA